MRILEWPDHPFFLATLYVPMARSVPWHPHPLVTALQRRPVSMPGVGGTGQPPRTLFDLTGKVAVVTGSGRGLGKAMAEGLAGHGAAVVACSRTAADAQATATAIEKNGGTAAATTVDTTDRASCERLIAFTAERFGRIDILINNAGTDVIKPAADYRPEEWRAVLSVNLDGYYHCAQLAGRRMIGQGGGGSIIMVSSIAGRVGIPGLLAYSASKGGVDQLVRTLAVEWAPHAIRVNAIAPGYFDNIMRNAAAEHANPERQRQVITFTPLGRRGRPAELVGPAVFLAAEASSYITGHVLYVDGGYTAM